MIGGVGVFDKLVVLDGVGDVVDDGVCEKPLVGVVLPVGDTVGLFESEGEVVNEIEGVGVLDNDGEGENGFLDKLK